MPIINVQTGAVRDHTPQELAAIEAMHNPVPISVTPRQIRLALLAGGHMAAVNAYVATLSESQQLEWEYATEVRRDNELILAAATGLGMSEAQADDLFRLAATL